MTIKEFHKGHLRNMEHYQFAIHVLEMAKEANLEKMKLLFKPLEEAIRHEDEALNPPRIDPATEELRLRDAERDRAYRSLQLAIEMGLLAEESATKEAAKKLREILSRYPGVLTADYDSETGALKNLLADLKPADAASALTRPLLSDWKIRMPPSMVCFAVGSRGRNLPTRSTSRPVAPPRMRP